MGRAFKAPKKTDAQQWKKVEALWLAGFRFWSSGSNSTGPYPARLNEVEAFIRRNALHPCRLRRQRP
ncbi:MAG: hypothetical protein J7483_11250 [Novosphingobium sp.]|nr:hypothetical protein [Novosphingobium sp.]